MSSEVISAPYTSGSKASSARCFSKWPSVLASSTSASLHTGSSSSAAASQKCFTMLPFSFIRLRTTAPAVSRRAPAPPQNGLYAKHVEEALAVVVEPANNAEGARGKWQNYDAGSVRLREAQTKEAIGRYLCVRAAAAFPRGGAAADKAVQEESASARSSRARAAAVATRRRATTASAARPSKASVARARAV